jgi:hypothetical protein
MSCQEVLSTMMAEEEAGFTFVDKRRSQTEDAAESPAMPVAETPTPAENLSPAEDIAMDEEDIEAPDIYGVIGYCLSVLAAEAWQKLGLLANPQTGEAVADLAQAKVAIDAAGDLASRLESAPQSSVPDAMRRELRTLLNDLRLNYVSRRDS